MASSGDAPIRVTIVIPVFNGADTIERISRYVEEQEFDGAEIVFVVDGRSTDDTLDRVNSLGMKTRISAIVQESGGLGEARNLGLEAAKGKYVWFLDSDDRPYPDFLRILHSTAEEHGADISQCNFIRSSSIDTKEPEWNMSTAVMSGRDALIERAHERIPVTAWSMLVRRDLLMNNGIRFQASGCAEDVDFIYRALEKCNVYCYCDRPLYLYYRSESGICFTRQNERGEGEVSAYDRLYEHFEEGDPEFHAVFRRRSALMRVRSAAHMDIWNFKRYVGSAECREMMRTELSDPLTPEYVWLRMSPTTYYIAMKVFLRFVYYRENRIFGRPLRR